MYKKYIGPSMVVVFLMLFVLVGTFIFFVGNRTTNSDLVKIVDFYQEAGNDYSFFARIKNTSSITIQPTILVEYLDNFKKVRTKFSNISPIESGEVKDINLNLEKKPESISFNKIEIKVSQGEKVLAKTSRTFVINNSSGMAKSLLMLTGATFGLGIFFISRFV